jgi:hypothetical protein
VRPAIPLLQHPNTISVALQILQTASEATSFRGALPSEANLEAEAEAGKHFPNIAATATPPAIAATTAVAAIMTAAGAIEAMLKGGRGAISEADTGLADRLMKV